MLPVPCHAPRKVMNMFCAVLLSPGGTRPIHAVRFTSQVPPFAVQKVALRFMFDCGSHQLHDSPDDPGCPQSVFPPFVVQSLSAAHAPDATAASHAAIAM